jgi:hypothetical protein
MFHLWNLCDGHWGKGAQGKEIKENGKRQMELQTSQEKPAHIKSCSQTRAVSELYSNEKHK